VAQLNFDNPEMRLAMIKAMKFWVLSANVDGFRCDYTDGLL
jgi:glycosidase